MQDAQHKNWQSALCFVTTHRQPQSTYNSQLGRAEGRHLASCVRGRNVIQTTATENGLHGATRALVNRLPLPSQSLLAPSSPAVADNARDPHAQHAD
jgi:hypothetical protein